MYESTGLAHSFTASPSAANFLRARWVSAGEFSAAKRAVFVAILARKLTNNTTISSGAFLRLCRVLVHKRRDNSGQYRIVFERKDAS